MGIVIEVWKLASAQAHSFLDPEFVAKAELDLREIYLPKTETWVYEVEGTVVGFISMISSEIGGLFVHPQFQSRGIGTGLVNFISKIFPELQVEAFEKNTVGKSFYLKYGFRLNKCYWHEPSGEMVMRLELT